MRKEKSSSSSEIMHLEFIVNIPPKYLNDNGLGLLAYLDYFRGDPPKEGTMPVKVRISVSPVRDNNE
jgi:hypothetical protein